jgi:hypothetical protein
VNKILFVAMMVWIGLTAAAGHAAGQPGVKGAATPTEHAVGAGGTPADTWTCEHNTYRSVTCI